VKQRIYKVEDQFIPPTFRYTNLEYVILFLESIRLKMSIYRLIHYVVTYTICEFMQTS
jgi:hypothetical protein